MGTPTPRGAVGTSQTGIGGRLSGVLSARSDRHRSAADRLGHGLHRPTTGTVVTSDAVLEGAAGNVLANGTFVTLDAQRRIKVFGGGPPGSLTHFVVDITGVMG